MSKLLTALGGVALGVAAYTLGELVQQKRKEYGDEDFGITDLLEELFDGDLQTSSDTQED